MTQLKKLTAIVPALCAGILFSGSALSATEGESLKVEELVSGLQNPWGMTFLPDKSVLITERSGAIRRFSAGKGLGEPLKNVPDVVANNQGGMLDIIADPEYASNNTLYFCYSRPGEGGSSSSVAKAVLAGTALESVETLFVANPLVDNGFHFGCRLAFDKSGSLLITLGDRYKFMDEAQNTSNHLGKIVRINKDGSVPQDNPFAQGKAPEVYSYGHRNVQGLTIHPDTQQVWAMEHGPKGGDEVNLIKKGANYGWPEITYGIDYSGDIISDRTEMDGMEQPVIYWDPSIAPSGMAFYTGSVFKDWQGDLLVGALKFKHLRRIEMDNGKPGEQFEYLKDREERIRDVEIGPDGFIYVLTDDTNGKLLKLSPTE